MLDAHCEMIMNEYRQNKPSFDKMKDIALDTLKQAIANVGILVTTIEGRVKEEKSLAGKLELKGYKYNSLADITDIFGARVVTFYTYEVDKIAGILENIFDIDWNDSVDKRKALASDQFGYLSLHYICRIPKRLYCDPEHPEINEYRFEIQMRTALQHVWATAYHDTGYKSEIEVPKEYVRALNRLAGMLEIADEQFSGIIDELAEYRRRVKDFIKAEKFDDLAIDGDTFGGYMDLDPFKTLNSQIAAINHAEIQRANANAYLEVFKMMGFKTLADVENLKKDYKDDAYKLAAYQLASTDLEILSSNIGVQNLCIVYMVKNGGAEMELRKFYDIIFGARERNQKSAKRTMEQLKAIGLVQ